MKQRWKKSAISMLLAVSLTGCSGSGQSSAEKPEREAATVDAIRFSTEGAAHTEQRFLADYSQLALSAPDGAEIYYTLDGSRPDKDSEAYAEPIVLEQYAGDFPHCVVLRAKAYFADGTESAIETHTFWTSFDINARFKNVVFSVVGDPAELTEEPDGIFYDKNVQLRGRESEREISVEAVASDGSLIFAQNAGMRPFGGASREAAIKSMKLFARKSYDENHGKFSFERFGTIGAGGDTIAKYDKLVLRNGGNDFQFAFIRDELNQRLAADAGYTDVEGVLPVVVYLNGEYYGLHWLHESICDDLLKDKYGGETGKYIILEGKEQEKKVPEDDDEEAAAAKEFNRRYQELSAKDLTDDAAYEEVCAFMDVENYLQYFAFNIYINNNDWPQNNQKCYRYAPAKGEALQPGTHMDGKWRFWFHDTDYSTGLYGQDETAASYNNLNDILYTLTTWGTREGTRSAPMFAALMQREDCRECFLAEMQRLMDDALSADHMIEVLDAMNAERFTEMQRYFDHLEELKETNRDIWIWYEEYQNRTNNIRNFAKERAGYMIEFLEQAFPETDETAETEPADEE